MSGAEDVQAARLALDEATEWPRQAAALRSRADALDVQITLEMGAPSHLHADLAKEQRDVDRYEGLSVPGVITSIIGRREQRLATEVSERDALALDVAVRNGALDRLRAQARDLRSQAGHPTEAEQSIHNARSAYLDALHTAGDPRGTQGLALNERIGTIKAATTKSSKPRTRAQTPNEP